jgi:hypothetical protein
MSITVLRKFRRVIASSLVTAGAATAILVGLNAAPASARPDPGSPVVSVSACHPDTDPRTIPVRRVGNHLARCDYLVR